MENHGSILSGSQFLKRQHLPSTCLIAGVDEAGRGPLLGPVVAAAVILNPEKPIAGLCDSKKLTPAKRQLLSDQIKTHALAWSVAQASVEEIDTLNILQASLLAMKRAIEGLSKTPEHVLVDGKFIPAHLSMPAHAIIKGDATEPEISAASILAKVDRDHLMLSYAERYPDYGIEQHKGYPTRAHLEALLRFGITPEHRRSFAPVKAVLSKTETDVVE